jgi:precorrin-6B methylase 2
MYKAMFILANDIFVPTLWGAKFVLSKSRSFAESRYFTIILGFVEPQWRDYFDKYIAKAKYFIDVGAASDAYYTIRACKLNPSIKIIAVEPLCTEYKYMLRNIALNSCTHNVIPLNIALSSTEGTITVSGQEIPCTTIDTLVQKLRLTCIDVIKIDVEGGGAEIIKGATKTIVKCKPVIFFEVHNKAERLAVKELKDLGYTAIEQLGDMYILIPCLISGH